MTSATAVALYLADQYEALAVGLRAIADGDDDPIAATSSLPPRTLDPADASPLAAAPSPRSPASASSVLNAVPPRQRSWMPVGHLDGESHRWPDPDGVVYFSSFEIY